MEFQKKLAEFDNNNELYIKLMELYDVLHQYQIPTITIEENHNLRDIANIFIMINNQGLKIAQKDLEKAKNWIKNH